MLTEPREPNTILGKIKESFRDLEVEYQARKEDVRHGYHKTTRAVGSSVRSLQTDIGEDWRELKADLRVHKQLIKEDWFDLTQAAREWKNRVSARRQESNPSATPPPASTSHQAATEAASVSRDISIERLKEDIRDYESQLAAPSFAEYLNESILSDQLSSANDMVEYYQERPELKDLTLDKDLERMTYTVYTHTGQKLTEPKDIVDYHNQAEKEHPGQHEILWRAANQSIFGDVISCLTADMGLVRPQFSSATFVDDVSVVLDLGRDKPHITAECFVNVSIPGEEGERLSLAGVLVGVYFCPVLDKMEARVLHISPGQPLSDAAVVGVAKSLLPTPIV